MEHLQIGSTLQNGKYRIVRVLGQGGFGITYEGEQTALGRRVAIKEFFMKEYCERQKDGSSITAGTAGSREIVEAYRKKFLKEARMMASFERVAHMVQIYDIFEDNDTVYYTMEYIGGGSLQAAVDTSGPMSQARAYAVIRQVAEALKEMHRRQVMHLDIKPANIMLRDDSGNADDVVLIDFGISKHYDPQGRQTTTTPVGYSKGYAPLEQYRDGGVQEFSPTTDIYSLGATLYFLLSAQTPGEATDLAEEPMEQPQTVSNEAWQVISRAMKSGRKWRYQSIEEMMQAMTAESEEIETVASEETKIAASQETFIRPQPTSQETVVHQETTPSLSTIRSTQDNNYRDVEIGDYFYSDGSTSHKRNHTKQCIGMVFSLNPTKTEREHGWTHGHIVGAQFAKLNVLRYGLFSKKIKECDELCWAKGPLTDYQAIIWCNYDVRTIMNDRDGYVNTVGSNLLNTDFEAFEAVRQYPLILPEGTSGWYLPAIGQLFDLAINLGENYSKPEVSLDNRLIMRPVEGWQTAHKLASMGLYLTGKTTLWSSTENGSRSAWMFNLPNSGYCAATSRQKIFAHHILPVAAF